MKDEAGGRAGACHSGKVGSLALPPMIAADSRRVPAARWPTGRLRPTAAEHALRQAGGRAGLEWPWLRS